MSITTQKKQQLISEYKTNDNDTGSVEVQCAILTTRIENLIEHLKINPKDHHTRRGLLILVGRRKRMMRYLEQKNHNRYDILRQKLGLRK